MINNNEVCSALLLGSYVGNLTTPVRLAPDLITPDAFRDALTALTASDLVMPTGEEFLLSVDNEYQFNIGAITPKGLEFLRNPEAFSSLSDLKSDTLVIHIQHNGSGDINVGQNVSTTRIEQVLIQMINQIDNSNASPAVKQEAKSKLAEFLKHPLVVALFGAAAEVAIKVVGG